MAKDATPKVVSTVGLLDCPMCGLHDKVKVYGIGHSFFVKCDGCGLTTGKYHHPQFAGAMWNSQLSTRPTTAGSVDATALRYAQSFIKAEEADQNDTKDIRVSAVMRELARLGTSTPELPAEPTEEMVAAGMGYYYYWRGNPHISEIVRGIYKAMRGKAP